MKKQSWFILFLLVLAAAFAFIYIKWNKPPVNVVDESGIRINAINLFREFSENEPLATKNYNGKVLEVTGIVSSTAINLEGKTIVQLQTDDLMFGINCTMEKDPGIINEGETVTIKGICSGFTTDVILIHCYLIKN